ncbi:MAG: ion transporter [Longimonas sp.]|uniref:ion transporter n=1 Tax=Longimonas sp. TaxID=2039626 RepID=UPI003975E28B
MSNASGTVQPGIKRIVYELLYPTHAKTDTLPNLAGDLETRLSTWSARIDVAIMALIVLSVLGVILESLSAVRTTYGPVLSAFERMAVVAFSIEYLARLWVCTLIPKFQHPVTGRLRWAATPLAIVDLVAILPFYLPFLGVDARFLRLFRLMRILRLAKLKRYLYTLRLFGRVWHNKRHEIIFTTALMLMLLLVSASLMYYVERTHQPDTFGSIPQAMWWAVATLTTVGYGDVTPISGLGRTLAAAVAMIGIGLFALPTSILGSGFVEELAKDREIEDAVEAELNDANPDETRTMNAPAPASPQAPSCTCPHCGESFRITLQAAPTDAADSSPQ